MGMLACYQMIEERKIKELLKKTADEVFETIEDLQEADEDSVLDIGKFWDGLHFLLTGTTASEALTENPLSAAVFGVTFTEDENTEFISYILPERVPVIMEALKCFDIESAIEKFAPETFAQNGIYPDIWIEEYKEGLQNELMESFQALKTFYEKTAEQGKGIIVSIY